MIKNPPDNAGSIPGSRSSLGKEMTTHSSILAWEIPWTEEPGGLQSVRSQRVEHYRVIKQHVYLGFWHLTFQPSDYYLPIIWPQEHFRQQYFNFSSESSCSSVQRGVVSRCPADAQIPECLSPFWSARSISWSGMDIARTSCAVKPEGFLQKIFAMSLFQSNFGNNRDALPC